MDNVIHDDALRVNVSKEGVLVAKEGMKKRAIALGFFDGVHLGHGALLKKTVDRANQLMLVPTALTFDHLPKLAVLGAQIPLINSLGDRIKLMHNLYGIEEVLVETFDEKMQSMEWERFLYELIIEKYKVAHIVVGHDFRFGYKNMGTAEMLYNRCQSIGIGCDIISPVQIDGKIVSSTYIRSLLKDGNLIETNRFLGHPHMCSVQIVKQSGDKLEFSIPQGLTGLPPEQYLTCTLLKNGKSFNSVTDFGNALIYLRDYDGSNIDKSISLEFINLYQQKVNALTGLFSANDYVLR